VVKRETIANRAQAKPRRANARRMRREPTAAELRFWYEVRDRRLGGLKFRRQCLIGAFITDFACPEHRLVVVVCTALEPHIPTAPAYRGESPDIVSEVAEILKKAKQQNDQAIAAGNAGDAA
jgi:hypothetical protein